MARQDPLRNFRFRLEIDNITRGGFSEVSGLGANVGVIDYREGTDPLGVRRLPGRVTYSNVTLKAGLTVGGGALDLFNWFEAAATGNIASARRRVAIVVADEQGQDQARFVLFEAWPARYATSPLDAKGNEVLVEILELVHEGIERAQ
jgi:phage tail-like protein